MWAGNSHLQQINQCSFFSQIYEQYFVNIYAELIVIQSLSNPTEDWTLVHETDCIGKIKAQNVICLGFLTSSTLFSTPRVSRSLKAVESLTPDIGSKYIDVYYIRKMTQFTPSGVK